jgi:hypothetical protein
VVGADNMALEEQNQWYFTEAELASTPSILSGIAPSDERCRRAKGVNFIIQAGIMLKLPQLTLATASVFFHRYFMRVSMDESKGGTHHYVSIDLVLPLPSSRFMSSLLAPPAVKEAFSDAHPADQSTPRTGARCDVPLSGDQDRGEL